MKLLGGLNTEVLPEGIYRKQFLYLLVVGARSVYLLTLSPVGLHEVCLFVVVVISYSFGWCKHLEVVVDYGVLK